MFAWLLWMAFMPFTYTLAACVRLTYSMSLMAEGTPNSEVCDRLLQLSIDVGLAVCDVRNWLFVQLGGEIDGEQIIAYI